MTPEEKKAFEEELYSWVGRETAPPTPALDDVNEAMIRHWCEVMGDHNPVYTNKEFAAQSSKKGIIAPPTMLQAWSLEGFPMAFERDAAELDGQRRLHAFMGEHGYTAVLGTNCDQEYFRDLRPGDKVIAHTVINSISEQKATAMGIGYFIETKTTFTDQHNEPIGSMLFRVLKFIPAQQAAPVEAGKSSAPAKPTRIKSVRGHDNGWWWNELEQNKIVPIQRCKSCQTLRHPPRPMCGECQSTEWDFIASSLKGEVFSFVVLHYPEIPGYDYPLVCAVIQLEEGTRIVSNIIGCKPGDVTIGDKVIGEVVEVDKVSTLPLFKLA